MQGNDNREKITRTKPRRVDPLQGPRGPKWARHDKRATLPPQR